MRQTDCALAIAGLAALSLSAAACAAKERATVTISYVVGPAKPLPEGLKAVAVIDAGVKTEGTQQDTREQKWSAMAADMVEAMLQNAAAQYDAPLAVAKRSETKRILEEKDLRLSGLVEGADATRAGKLLAVQGLVTSKIIINIDLQKGSKSTLDWGGVLGGVVSGLTERDRDRRDTRDRRAPIVVRRVPPDPRVRNPRDPRARPRYNVYAPRPARTPRPAGGPLPGGMALKTKEVEEISRSLTVQCSFSLIDATTGRAIAQYSPPPYQKTDSSSPDFLFGGMVDEGELDPVDPFIGELVERAAQEFVGTLVPVHCEKQYALELSGKRGETAARLMRADDFAGALQQLEPLVGTKDDDDGNFSFAAGVANEMLGRFDRALKLYRQAAAAPDVDEKKELPRYLEAKKRLTDHLARIVPPSALKPATEAEPEVEAEGAAPAAPPAAAAGTQPASPPISEPAPPSGAGSPQTVDDEIRMIKELEAKKKN